METTTQQAQFVLAYALACQEKLPRNKRINLRQGELAFRGDYEFLKRRLYWVAVCVLAIAFSWVFASYAQYRVLDDRVQGLRERQGEITKRLFGEEIYNLADIELRLKQEKSERPPMPEKDAFDIIIELSKRIPVSIVHDVEFLEIKPKRVTLKGVVDAQVQVVDGDAGVADAGSDLSPTDLISQQLQAFTECFTQVRITKVSAVGERRRYEMGIDSKCP